MGDSFWDSEEEIGTIHTKGRENLLKIKIVEKNGAKYVDIRKFYMDESGGEAPTKKGLSIQMEYFDEVLAALNSIKSK